MTGRPRRSRWSRPRKASTIPGARNMEEGILQSRVEDYATRRRMWHWHDRATNHLAAQGDPRRNKKGFLDFFGVGNWVMFRELKSDSDSATVSKEQRELILRLEEAGADVGIWWPIDWESGRIQAEIDACTRKRKATGQLVLPDMGKTLYLLTQAGVEARAGLMWDAGAKGIDRVTWQENGRHVLKTIANALPRTDEEKLAWLVEHDLGPDAGAAAIIEALRGDLLRTHAGAPR